MTDRLPGDAPDAALDAFKQAATVEPVSPFALVRAGRALDAAIDADVRARSRWTTSRVAAVTLAAAASAGAVAFILSSSITLPRSRAAAQSARMVDTARTAGTSAVAHPEVEAQPESRPIAAVTALPEAGTPPLDLPDLPGLRTLPEAPEQPERAKRRKPTLRGESERLIAAGDHVGAARVWLHTGDDAAAASALALIGRRYPDALTAIDDELAALRSTDMMRLRCQHLLLHERTRVAMDACRAFGQEHPHDPAARLLSFAAGRLAEDLDDLAWAEEEYSRALLLSPFAGLSGTDALLARARVRFAAGDIGEARADLRLYLHNEPAARNEAEVAKLATALGL